MSRWTSCALCSTARQGGDVYKRQLYYLLRLLPVFSPEVALTAAIVASLPAMSSTAIFARAGNSEAADYVTQCVMMTTLFSLVTIPLVLWLCR